MVRNLDELPSRLLTWRIKSWKISSNSDKFIEKFPRKLLSGSRWAGVRAVVPKGERFTLADAYGSVWAFSIYQSGRPSNSRSVCFSPFYHFGFFFKKKEKIRFCWRTKMEKVSTFLDEMSAEISLRYWDLLLFISTFFQAPPEDCSNSFE